MFQKKGSFHGKSGGNAPFGVPSKNQKLDGTLIACYHTSTFFILGSGKRLQLKISSKNNIINIRDVTTFTLDKSKLKKANQSVFFIKIILYFNLI